MKQVLLTLIMAATFALACDKQGTDMVLEDTDTSYVAMCDGMMYGCLNSDGMEGIFTFEADTKKYTAELNYKWVRLAIDGNEKSYMNAYAVYKERTITFAKDGQKQDLDPNTIGLMLTDFCEDNKGGKVCND